MSWAQPWWGLLALVVVALGALRLGSDLRHSAGLTRALGEAMALRLLPLGVRVRRALAALATFGGLLLCVLALVEPRFGKELVEIKREGVDIVLIVDLSTSMAARDVEPDRLERARREILDLMTLLEGDRVGMVVYAGGAYPRLPLTRDLDILKMIVQELDVRTFRSQGSELGEALRTGLKLMDDQGGAAGRAMLVISDGETHAPDDALAAAEEAAARDVRVFSLLVGEAAAPIPLPDGTYLRWKGETVSTTPDDTTLKALARLTGGAYARSVPGIDDMQALYRDGIRAKLNATQTGAFHREVWRSAFQVPLGLGLALLLFGAWLGDGGGALGRGALGWLRRVGAVAALLLALVPAAQAASLAEGDRAYRAERWRLAEDIFAELAVEQPDNPDVFGRLGAARYRMGDYEGAARAFETQARLSQGTDANASYNAGNAAWQAGRLEDALRHFDQALAADPNHGAARQNKGIAEAELAERRKRVPPPPKQGEGDNQQQGGGGGGENQDQQQAGDQGGEQGEGQQEQQGGEGKEPQPGQDLGRPGGKPGGQSDASGGEPQQGQPGQGGEQGEQPSDPQGAPQQSGGQTDEGGERDERGKGSEAVGPGEIEDLEQRQGGEGGQGSQGEDPGSGDAVQAERALEGVKEGRPRVVLNPGRGDKPW